MILPRRTSTNDRFLGAAPATPCFVVAWTTGPDTTLDGVVRVAARRRASAGGWEEFDRWCDPRDGVERTLPGQDEWRARFGRAAEELANEPPARAAWEELRAFVGDSPLVVPDGASFRAWSAHLSGNARFDGPATSLSELAALLFPGKLAQRRENLLAVLVEPTHGTGTDAYGPADLELAIDELARRFLERDEGVLRIAVLALRHAWDGFGATDPEARSALGLALALVDRRALGSECAAQRSEPLGPLSALLATDAAIEDLIEDAEPRCTRELERWRDFEHLPADDPGAAPFHEDDARVLDDVFERRLPESFATPGSAPNDRAS
ncbi:MAG: hypothetical protein HZA53_14360, partial [Planctomycetes bacterium]|nr:hypothetical protein [Planctomycetota bacterium]